MSNHDASLGIPRGGLYLKKRQDFRVSRRGVREQAPTANRRLL
jgi:hypothetical protein